MFAYAQHPVRQSLQEYGRGIAGGLLFSLPLLYTMEVWWAGFLIDSSRLLICLVATFLLLLAYNRYAGIHPGVRLFDVVVDSVEEFGLGILLSALILFLLGRVTPDMPREEILGKIVLEAMLVSIGVSVGTAQLGMQSGDLDEEVEGEPANDDGEASSRAEHYERRDKAIERGPSDLPERPHIREQAALCLCGAVLFAANIAPTEEIVVIATESPPWRTLSLVGISLALVGYLVYDMWTGKTGPPQIEVTVGQAAPQAGGYVIPVEVRNGGQEVAEQVHVEVTLSRNGEKEVGNFVIQFLPRGASRNGAVTFATDPKSADRLVARVLGYQRP